VRLLPFALMALYFAPLPKLWSILSIERTLLRRPHDLAKLVNEFLIDGPIVTSIAINQVDNV
jgi:hypothetical protein